MVELEVIQASFIHLMVTSLLEVKEEVQGISIQALEVLMVKQLVEELFVVAIEVENFISVIIAIQVVNSKFKAFKEFSYFTLV